MPEQERRGNDQLHLDGTLDPLSEEQRERLSELPFIPVNQPKSDGVRPWTTEIGNAHTVAAELQRDARHGVARWIAEAVRDYNAGTSSERSQTAFRMSLINRTVVGPMAHSVAQAGALERLSDEIGARMAGTMQQDEHDPAGVVALQAFLDSEGGIAKSDPVEAAELLTMTDRIAAMTAVGRALQNMEARRTFYAQATMSALPMMGVETALRRAGLNRQAIEAFLPEPPRERRERTTAEVIAERTKLVDHTLRRG